MDPERAPLDISRRNLLIGGGIGAGLLIAWTAWPRRYEPNLRTAPGETIFNAYLKIGNDGRVVVAVPQSELGQGVYTSLPQILADELGADWRTVSVEPAPISPIYANRLLVEDLAENALPPALRGISGWAVREYATRSGLMLTAGSTSIRAFEAAMREAGAAGRALLSKAAADRWDVDWESLDTRAGFVVRGKDRISFAELADAAAGQGLPKHLPVRGGNDHRLAGQPLPRLDLPAKVDGTAQYACDIRLPNMVYGSVRQGPDGAARVVRIDRSAATKVAGVVALIEQPGWVGAVATNWWAANRAVERMAPRFETGAPLIGSGDIDAALARALDGGKASRLFSRGDTDAMFEGAGGGGGKLFRTHYQVGLAPSAPLETLAATVRITGDRVEVWAPTQAPGLARAAAARAAGVSEAEVTLYRTLIGGGYGRKLETQAIEQAVIMARQVKRPVQLVWSRIEETMHDGFRPPARALLTASLGQGNIITGWRARIAAPSTVAEVSGRLHDGKPGPQDESEEAAVAGAVPPYTIGAVAVDHVPAAIGVRTGIWRSGAHSYTAFFTECFIDELARQAGMEPLSFRMQMLGDNPRLARVLSTAAALGGWDGGGAGSMMGLAAHSAFGSHAATVVEVEIDERSGGQVRVKHAICAVDCGRIVNPEIVRQQVEGGLMFGIAAATGMPIAVERGLVTAQGFGQLGLPTLANSPDIIVELVESDEDPGGITELSVPTAAPAIANALFALSGRRLRSLPLEIGTR